MKIDAFCHILPARYAKEFFELDVPAVRNLRNRTRAIPALTDLGVRFRQMDEFGDYRQIINVAAPALEDFGPPARCAEFARLGNEGLAELVAAHPGRFAGFCAAVALNDVDRALEEIDFSFTELGALGVQIYCHVNGHPLDEPRFDPLWARLAESGKLVQVHPNRTAAWPDYPAESRSRFEIWWAFGWEYDLSAFMARMVFSGVLARWPGLKFLVHHGGAMVPHFAGRVGPGWDQLGTRTPESDKADVTGYPLAGRPIDYFRKFHVDTALFGAEDALRTVIRFYGADKVLFASDSPYDPEQGPGYIRATIGNLASLDLTDAERNAIYHGNVTRLLDPGASTAAG
ncbi:amidohydrolase family protein [Amycolatopsis sp. NPDC059021]|uniref:amidohydrolase family protein n=1 Tax=Amycolatopsis sp. NPDC059021 TaxID=3346704 RepID=UPI00366F6E0D